MRTTNRLSLATPLLLLCLSGSALVGAPAAIAGQTTTTSATAVQGRSGLSRLRLQLRLSAGLPAGPQRPRKDCNSHRKRAEATTRSEEGYAKEYDAASVRYCPPVDKSPTYP